MEEKVSVCRKEKEIAINGFKEKKIQLSRQEKETFHGEKAPFTFTQRRKGRRR